MPDRAPPGPATGATAPASAAPAGPALPAPDPLARARRLLSFALLAALVTLKASLAAVVFDLGPDGSYYAEVARNVRDGAGLVSWASMYHAGAPSLPYPTPIYPLWPLLLGHVGRVVPLPLAAVWLPTLLSLGAVLLAARYARTLWPRPLLPDLWEVPDAGHLAIVLLGFNPLFLEYTAKPYTEALGFVLLFWALLRAGPLFSGAAGPARALELGLYAGLLVLVRAQLFLFTLALFATFAFAVLTRRPRSRWLGLTAAAAAGFGLAVAPQLIHLSGFHAGPVGLGALLRFEQFRPTDLMSPVQMLIRIHDPLAYVLDRAQGFAIAYAEVGKYAYARNFGVLHWAPVVALAAWLPALARRDALRAALAAARRPENGPFALFALLALGGFFSIHTLHKSYGAEWNFATRHALTVLFLFGGGLLLAAARPGLSRVLAVSLLAVTLVRQWDDVAGVLRDASEQLDDGPVYRSGAVALLAREQAARGRLVVLSEKATRFAWELPGVENHWVWQGTGFDDLEALYTGRDAAYLVVHRADRMLAFDDPRFTERYVKRFSDLSGMDVYVRDPDEAARLADEAARLADEAARPPDEAARLADEGALPAAPPAPPPGAAP